MVEKKQTKTTAKAAPKTTAKTTTKAAPKATPRKTTTAAAAAPKKVAEPQKVVLDHANKAEPKYDWRLVSNNFMKRSAAVFGHYMVFSMIVGFITFIFFAILWMIFFAMFASHFDRIEIKNNWDYDYNMHQIQKEIERIENKYDRVFD